MFELPLGHCHFTSLCGSLLLNGCLSIGSAAASSRGSALPLFSCVSSVGSYAHPAGGNDHFHHHHHHQHHHHQQHQSQQQQQQSQQQSQQQQSTAPTLQHKRLTYERDFVLSFKATCVRDYLLRFTALEC